MTELRTIILPGILGKKFGKFHKLAVNSAAEAVHALGTLLPGFRQFLLTSKQKGLEFAVFVGKNNIGKEELTMNSSSQSAIKIVPLITGQKAGVLQTVLGIGLVVVGFAFEQPWAVKLGAALVLGGVVQMLTPQAATDSSSTDNGTSYNFNGPVNTSAQGVPVPLAYGRILAGSAIISGGITAEDQ